jgi:hypothetical protein
MGAGCRLWAGVGGGGRFGSFSRVRCRFWAVVVVFGRSFSFSGGRLRSWSVGVDVVAARTLVVGVVFCLWPWCRWCSGGGGGGAG